MSEVAIKAQNVGKQYRIGKRERYRTQNANVEQIGRQISRVEDRMAMRIRELVPNEREAIEKLRRELEAARGQRYTIKGV